MGLVCIDVGGEFSRDGKVVVWEYVAPLSELVRCSVVQVTLSQMKVCVCGIVVTLGGVVDVIPPVTTLTVVVLDIIFGVVMVVVAVIIGELWLQ